MTERNIGAEILAGLKEIKEFKQGKVRLKTAKLSVPQSAFASMMGVSEQGRRTPRSLLRIAEQNPKAFLSGLISPQSSPSAAAPQSPRSGR
jgi:putative transcriptional regulator